LIEAGRSKPSRSAQFLIRTKKYHVHQNIPVALQSKYLQSIYLSSYTNKMPWTINPPTACFSALFKGAWAELSKNKNNNHANESQLHGSVS